jgi:hypothetical protein
LFAGSRLSSFADPAAKFHIRKVISARMRLEHSAIGSTYLLHLTAPTRPYSSLLAPFVGFMAASAGALRLFVPVASDAAASSVAPGLHNKAAIGAAGK